MRPYNLSKEGRARMVARNKRLPENPKWREGMRKSGAWRVQSIKAAFERPESKARRSKAMTKRWEDPAQRAKLCASVRRAMKRLHACEWPKIERDADEAFRAAKIRFDGAHGALPETVTRSQPSEGAARQGGDCVALT